MRKSEPLPPNPHGRLAELMGAEFEQRPWGGVGQFVTGSTAPPAPAPPPIPAPPWRSPNYPDHEPVADEAELEAGPELLEPVKLPKPPWAEDSSGDDADDEAEEQA